MKKIIIGLVLLSLFAGGIAYARMKGVDMKCVDDCVAQGYIWGYCYDKCSYYY
jgi:hypothetical protein